MAESSKKYADEKLKEAYSKYYSSIYRFCLSKLKTDTDGIEDIVQEAYLVMYNKYLENINIEYPLAFLMKTADNLVKKQFSQIEKMQKQVPIEEVVHIESQNEDIDDKLTFEQYSKQISDALNETDAELFSMRYVEELKIDEIASRMEMSIPAVTTRLSRIREKLRRIFSVEEFST